LIDRVIAAASEHGAAAPAIPVVDTLRNVSGEVVDRTRLVGMQTPQASQLEAFLLSHEKSTLEVTDDIALLEQVGMKAVIVPGESANFKITTEDDLAKARGIAGFRETRSGFGYDIHRFSQDPDRPMMVGGVMFDGPGLEGHSDADALLHAVVDSVLGAAGLGDIGVHFPNSDPRWHNKPSIEFVHYAADLVGRDGWQITNIDATIVAEHPKVMSRAQEIRVAIAEGLGIAAARVSVKATTNEMLGAIGRGEGFAAFAVATLVEA
jgi:2-C-methyl-D-erythritol 4-phosphate cytidylyltransferase/2-C-methyl-D-erythritol 2,4-cyclodiphosphate synthase